MKSTKLVPLGLTEGVWTARLSEEVDVEVTYLGVPVEGVSVDTAAADGPLLRVPVPTAAISDGVQTFVVIDRSDRTPIGHFSIVAGEPLEHDLRAEIDLLRAEFDMLKKAFRRQVSGD